MKEINCLENNYNKVKLYFRQMKRGLISIEEYEEKKKNLFENNTWKIEFNKLKGKKVQKYSMRAYAALFALYYINKAITQEEFERYSERLK